MDAEERELFAGALARATGGHAGAALDDALAELGWRDALAVDRRVAVSTLFELQGRTLSTSAALDHVILDALGVDHDATTAVVLPALGRSEPAGTLAGDVLRVAGLGTAALGRSSTAATPYDGGSDGIAHVPTSSLDVTAVGGVDPAFGGVTVDATEVRAGGWKREAAEPWPSGLAAGRLALAHELVGASRAVLDLAREHALTRVQFDRTVSGFQAVRHKLAESLVAVEAADAAATAAWDDGSPFAAMVAKAVAGRSAKLVVRHCQQVLAGIGFTIEHPLHGYVRRVLVLDRLLGSSRSLTHEVGTQLLESRRVPEMIPL